MRGRAGTPGPFDSIGGVKRSRVRRMAAQWLAERRPQLDVPAHPDLRFDAIGVSMTASGRFLALDHLEDAF